jgi:hypothetical protein
MAENTIIKKQDKIVKNKLAIKLFSMLIVNIWKKYMIIKEIAEI